jgi:radical SAM superfamily enzyme YgiQ (UPF0313 family)
MNVVLFYPSPRFGGAAQPRTELPQSLLAIATPLDLAGYKVRIIDQRIEPHWKEVLLAEIEKQPICFGVSSMTGPQIRYGLEASKIIKQNSNIPVIWGGVHPSLLPEQTLENENVDIVVQGEGEETFFELVQALEKGNQLKDIRGIWHKEKGMIKRNPPRPFIDLNVQPPLSYHLVNVEKHLIKVFGVEHLSLFTSRGCPHRCAFCYNTAFYKRAWRGLTSEEILKRIKRIKAYYGIKGIIFTDDLFLINKKRVKEVFEGFVEEKIDIICSKLDVHVNELSSLDDDFLKLIEKCGCKILAIGAESGSQRILNLLKKDYEIPQLIDFNKRLSKFKIIPSYYFIVGYPTETREDISQTVSLMLKLLNENRNAVKAINIYTPYPGTELFDFSVKHGFKVPWRLEEWVSLNWRTVNRTNMPWISKDREKLLKMLHCSSLFIEKKRFRDPFKKTHPLIVLLARLYHPIAKWRLEKLFYRFLFEIKMVEWLGIYRRQQ